MFENPRRGRQARNFATNAPKILDLKSSSEQIFSRKLPLGDLKVQGEPIQSREQFITVCSRVAVKDNACISLLKTKNPLQIPSGARGPYIGGIQHCLLYHIGVVKRFPLFQRKKSLNLTQHGNSLTELITEVVNMVIKREFLINCDT